MEKHKRVAIRVLSALLCIVMIVSLVPIAVFATENKTDVVSYNLGRFPVFVGSDPSMLESGEIQDVFNEDGSYTIELENDAFFPYQIKLSSEDTEEIVWFNTPEDTVLFAGHTFNVHSESVDSSAISQIGVTVNGTYIPAYPEQKNFRPMLLRSMMPLREKRVSIDLTGYLPAELSNIPVQTVVNALANEDVQVDGDVAVYAKWDYYDENGNNVNENDDFILVDDSKSLNLTNNMPLSYSNDNFTLELIVGTADQLNLDNVRYIVRVSVSSVSSIFKSLVDVYCADEDATIIPVHSIKYNSTWLIDDNRIAGLNIYADDTLEFSPSEAKVSMKFKDGVEEWSARVVEGLYYSIESVPDDVVDITAELWNADLTAGEGYQGHHQVVTFILTKNDVVQMIPVMIYIRTESALTVNYSDIFIKKENQWDFDTVSLWDTSTKEGSKNYRHYTYELGYGVPVDGNYSITLEFNGEDSSNYGRNNVDRAYAAHYESEDEIPAEAENIADLLFQDPYGRNNNYFEADFSEGVEFTVIDKQGKFYWTSVKTIANEQFWTGFNYSLNNENGNNAGYVWSRNWYKEPAEIDYRLNSNTFDSDVCYISLSTLISESSNELIEKAVIGNYSTLEDIPAEAEDITEQLFSSRGYPINFDSTTYITAIDKDGSLHTIAFNIPKAPSETTSRTDSPLSEDTYFNIRGVLKTNDDTSAGDIYCWVMPNGDDSYYYNGYQTVLVMNRTWKNRQAVWSPITSENVLTDFYYGKNVKMFAGIDKAAGELIIPRETPVSFTSGKAIQFSAASEDSKHLKNYWVTFLTQQSGPKLFVNATNDEGRYETLTDAEGKPVIENDQEVKVPTREIFIMSDYGNKHDVFFANIGDAPITGLYARLENPEGIKLDDFWKVGETTTLSAFTTTEKRDADNNYINYGELANVGKIRISPITKDDGSIEFSGVSGTLVIGYDLDNDNVPEEEYRIKLSGIVGDLAINTETVSDGIKYVPYSQLIQTNNMYDDDAVSFEISDGTLPKGITLRAQTGELYGIPMETGKFTFTVKANARYSDKVFSAEKEYTLVVNDNTKENVNNASDENYGVLTVATNEHPIITSKELIDGVVTNYNELRFVSEGEYSQFVAFYIDGIKQTEKDYRFTEGSVVLDILSASMSRTANGPHTLAMEFRNNGVSSDTIYSPMHRTVHYFEMAYTTPSYYIPSTITNTVNDNYVSQNGPVPLAYNVENGKVLVSSISDNRVNDLNSERNPDAIIDLSNEDQKIKEVVIPSDVIETLAKSLSDGNTKSGILTIAFKNASVELDETVIESIKQQISKEFVISITDLKPDDLNSEQKSAIEDREYICGVRISAMVDGNTVKSFNGGRAKIYINNMDAEKINPHEISAFYLKDDGKLLRHATDYADKQFIFNVTHFSDYVVLKDSEVLFADVKDGNWYSGVVDYVARSGIMVGDGNSMFAPETKLTRAMLVQILYNLEKAPFVDEFSSFEDVDDNAWYANSVAWAAKAGIVVGNGNGQFMPDQYVTREQLALMLYRYANYKNYQTDRRIDLLRFSDRDSISDWAEDAMNWAVAEKFFVGNNYYTINAGDSATRAQGAKVLAYFIETYML